jgi:hypothetical protein
MLSIEKLSNPNAGHRRLGMIADDLPKFIYPDAVSIVVISVVSH